MNNRNKIILDLCGGSGSWSKPYRDAGYDVKLITLPKRDIRDFFLLDGDKIHGIIAAPPCTEFSIAKNHSLHRDIDGGLEIVKACLRIIEQAKPVWWALENPVGLLQNYIGKPVYSFQPWWFGDGWSKRTMLWGNFKEPVQQYFKFLDCPQIEGLYVRPGRKVPSIAFNHKSHKKHIRVFDEYLPVDDAAFRAITPPGFARAFFKSNP